MTLALFGGQLVTVGGALAIVASGANPAPTDIQLSASSIAFDAAASTVVGALTVTDPGESSWSWAITAGGTKFELSASTGSTVNLRRSASGSLTAGVNENVTVQVTDGASNVYSEEFVITVTDPAADSEVMTLTITNASGSAKTNEPFWLPIPLAADALAPGQTLRVYDDNGSGAKGSVLANFQVTDQSTDLNGDTRLTLLTGTVPSLSGSGTRKLFVEASSTAAPTGTAITASDLLATEFRAVVECDIGGTTWSFDTDAALAAGASFSKTDYMCVVRSSGPTSTRWYVAGPPRNGGSPHESGDGIRVCGEIVAFKAGPAAVSGGNPITSAWADFWVENGDVVRSSPADYFYGYTIRRATSLSDGTLITTDDADADGNVIRYNYPREAGPTGTLTATSATLVSSTASVLYTWTRSAGVWASDIIGAHIRAGGGGAVVVTRTNDTTVQVRLYQAMSTTSFASGEWSIEGIGHHYNVVMPPRRIYVGTKPTSVCIWGNVASAVTADTRAPMETLAASGLFLNNQTTYASVSHSMTNLNLMRSADGSRRPLTFRGGEGVRMGEVETDIGKGGWEPGIGPMPEWALNAIVKWNADGRRHLFENAEYWSTWEYGVPPRLSGSPTNGQLGLVPRVDGGTTYKFNSALAGTQIATPTRWWPYDGDTSHHPAALYPAYLLSGDMFWLRAAERIVSYGTDVGFDNTFYGSGTNKTPFGDAQGTNATAMNGGQTRAKAWTTRDLLQWCTMLPDAIPDTIAHAKTHYKDRVQKAWDAIKAYGADDTQNMRPGTNNAPEWIKENSDRAVSTITGVLSSPRIEAGWQMAFVMCTLAHAREAGMLDADGLAAMTWFARYPVTWYTDTANLVRPVMFDGYYMMLRENTTFSGYPSTWAQIYQRSALIAPGDNQGDIGGDFLRLASGTVTVSDTTVGSGRTITFSNSYFGAGSWYVGGIIRATGGGTARITSVTSATEVVVDILVAFASSTPTASTVRLPGYAPADYAGQHDVVDGSSTDYTQFQTAALCWMVDAGLGGTDATNALAWITGRSGYSEVRPQFNVAVRS